MTDDYLSLRDQKLGTHMERVVLPDDWFIPETIQKQSFRDPWKMIGRELLRVKVRGKPEDNLDPNPKEREILRVRYIFSFIEKIFYCLILFPGKKKSYYSQKYTFFSLCSFFIFRTGKTEYEDAIGKTGDFVMKEKPYGLPLPIEPVAIFPAKDDPDKKSECSIILASENIGLPSNVF